MNLRLVLAVVVEILIWSHSFSADFHFDHTVLTLISQNCQEFNSVFYFREEINYSYTLFCPFQEEQLEKSLYATGNDSQIRTHRFSIANQFQERLWRWRVGFFSHLGLENKEVFTLKGRKVKDMLIK